MSKKKDVDAIDAVSGEDTIAQLKKDINKKYDSNVCVNAMEIIEKERKLINTSPLLDIALGGGIYEGSFNMLSGIPQVGKTTLSLQIAANAQERYSRDIFIGNIERRISKRELCSIHNLNPSKVEIIQSQKKKILTSEEFLSEFMNIISNVESCVLIIDSASALCSSSEYSNDITSTARPNNPKLFANFCRRMCSVVPIQNVTIILIAHLISNTSGWGSPWYEDSGNKLKFQCDNILRATSFQKWELKDGDQDSRVGQVTNWQIIKSGIGKPGTKVQSYLRYNYGIDDIKEYCVLGMDLGIINKGGAWYSIQYNGQEYKYQGEEKLRNGLIDNPELLEYIKKETNMVLK